MREARIIGKSGFHPPLAPAGGGGLGIVVRGFVHQRIKHDRNPEPLKRLTGMVMGVIAYIPTASSPWRNRSARAIVSGDGSTSSSRARVSLQR